MKNKNWDSNLTPEQNYILKQEGTEAPGSSELNNEKREGSYHCVACGTKLLTQKQNLKVEVAGPLLRIITRCFRRKKRYVNWLS